MASLYITEYSGTASQQTQIAMTPAVAHQKLAIGSETDSAAFNINTRFIRVHVDAICSILIENVETAATATTSMTRMAADQTEYFGVVPGGKLSVITNT
jgi:hypothetical protein